MKKSEQTRAHIRSAFLSLMAEKKWDKITVREICQSASLTRGTFYQYYSDIYDLMEQLESHLLEDLSTQFQGLRSKESPPVSLSRFLDRFNVDPPLSFLAWFQFCQEHAAEILPLLDRAHGDPYFVKRLRTVLEEQMSFLMDRDGMPQDELRAHFVPLLSEMHLLSVQSWLSSGEDPELTAADIVNLLNTTRVGSVFLSWRQAGCPDQKGATS